MYEWRCIISIMNIINNVYLHQHSETRKDHGGNIIFVLHGLSTYLLKHDFLCVKPRQRRHTALRLTAKKVRCFR